MVFAVGCGSHRGIVMLSYINIFGRMSVYISMAPIFELSIYGGDFQNVIAILLHHCADCQPLTTEVLRQAMESLTKELNAPRQNYAPWLRLLLGLLAMRDTLRYVVL